MERERLRKKSLVPTEREMEQERLRKKSLVQTRNILENAPCSVVCMHVCVCEIFTYYNLIQIDAW